MPVVPRTAANLVLISTDNSFGLSVGAGHIPLQGGFRDVSISLRKAAEAMQVEPQLRIFPVTVFTVANPSEALFCLEGNRKFNVRPKSSKHGFQIHAEIGTFLYFRDLVVALGTAVAAERQSTASLRYSKIMKMLGITPATGMASIDLNSIVTLRSDSRHEVAATVEELHLFPRRIRELSWDDSALGSITLRGPMSRVCPAGNLGAGPLPTR